MKTLKYILQAALTISLAACSQDEDFAPQGDSDAVCINASIGSMPQSRLEYNDDTTTFEKGDQIQVENTKRTTENIATYTYDGSSWSTNEFLLWNHASNQFKAYYPVTDYSSFETFKLPTDQSTNNLLAAADWMTIGTNEMTKPTDKTLKLKFEHRLTKVTVVITKFNDEFLSQTGIEISAPKIYSKGTNITATYSQDATTSATTVTITSDQQWNAISPMVVQPENGSYSNATFTAIVAPVGYAESEQFMTFKINRETLTVLAKAIQLNKGLEPGKHYTFSLTVGKKFVQINTVNVVDWTPNDISGGVAEEVVE